MSIITHDTDGREISLTTSPESNGGVTLFVEVKRGTHRIVSFMLHLNAQDARILAANFPKE